MRTNLICLVLVIFTSCGPHVKILRPLSRRPQNELVTVFISNIGKTRIINKGAAAYLRTKPLVPTILRIRPEEVLIPVIKHSLVNSKIQYKFHFPEILSNGKSSLTNQMNVTNALIMEFKILKFLFKGEVDSLSKHLVRYLHILIRCSLRDKITNEVIWEALINERVYLNHFSFVLVRNNGAKIKKKLSDKIYKALLVLLKHLK